jgi:hypothetical protein
MHKAPGKGGRSQPAINLCTSCASLGLTHHHTPPSGLAILTTIIFTWASPKQTPLLFTPTVLSWAIAHNCCFNPLFIPFAYPTQLYLPPLVTDRPVTHRKSVTFDGKAKVGALVQRAHTFKRQKLAEEEEEELQKEQQVLACAVSTRKYTVVQHTGSVTGRAKTT